MFNTQIIDVAIGLIFVYLLLSLICSAIHEIIETALKKRAIDLERGIRELLTPGSKSGTADLVREIYNHPMVNGLFGDLYEDSRINSAVRYVWRTKLPSYIPSRSFALALMDVIHPAQPAPAPPLPSGAAASGAAGASPAKFEVKLDTVPAAPQPSTTPGSPLEGLRNEVTRSALLAGAPKAQSALLTLIDAAGNDAAQARQNIEDWYNSSMDRVSGWYKRRAQVVLLIIGLVTAVLLNADSVTIVRALNSDRNLREIVVAAAIKAANEATPSPTPSGTEVKKPANEADQTSGASKPAVKPTPASSPAATPASSPASTETPAQSTTPIPAASPGTNGSPSASPTPTPECPPAACKDDKDSAECRLKKSKCELQELGLPIGWSSPSDLMRQWPGTNLSAPGGWLDQLYWHLFGWLLTAIAISLGAPFWFDLLNKFIVIRGTVKPKEKSGDEKSKD